MGDAGRPRALVIAALAVALGGVEATARADSACTRALDELGVSYQRVRRKGIAVAVRIEGPIGGITYRSYTGEPLILDCSLVYSLARVGRFLAQAGLDSVTYSSAYDRRMVRGTNRPSRHSFGLAIDVHTFSGEEVGSLTVKEDYEQGLGDDLDCVGRPLTKGGAILRLLGCQFERSELFRIVLTPDYDADHYNHFHLEALPWRERRTKPRAD